jgi:hypothetical protein
MPRGLWYKSALEALYPLYPHLISALSAFALPKAPFHCSRSSCATPLLKILCQRSMNHLFERYNSSTHQTVKTHVGSLCLCVCRMAPGGCKRETAGPSVQPQQAVLLQSSTSMQRASWAPTPVRSPCCNWTRWRISTINSWKESPAPSSGSTGNCDSGRCKSSAAQLKV